MSENLDPLHVVPPEIYSTSFAQGADGWAGDFADYPSESEYAYSLEWGWRLLPFPLEGHGLQLAGVNRSDDLFMYMKRKITGLTPSRSYLFGIEVTFATDAPSGAVGVGGAPGESVWVKAGVTTQEPLRSLDDGYWRMTVDKGSQANSGSDAIVLGNVANSSPADVPRRYELKTLRSSPIGQPVSADADGSVWLLVGTDSGFEAGTSLFYTNIKLWSVPLN